MKSTGVLFNGDMVRAILDGRKTQTRRPIKPYPAFGNGTGRWTYVASSTDKASRDTWMLSQVDPSGHRFTDRGREAVLAERVRCPFGVPGDELWVREVHAELPVIQVPPGRVSRDGLERKSRVVYRADGELEWLKWTPSIHMPRWASRLTLRLTEVRVQRLRDITEDDARAEGFLNRAHFITAFWAMYPTEPNPWVWALTFKAVSR